MKQRYGPLALLLLALGLVVGACGGGEPMRPATLPQPGDTTGGDHGLRRGRRPPHRHGLSQGGADRGLGTGEDGVGGGGTPTSAWSFNFQDDDLSRTIGLLNLLNGGEAPDIYFEWAGARLQSRYDEGFVADITEAVNGELGSYFDEGAFNGMVIDDKNVMVPDNAE